MTEFDQEVEGVEYLEEELGEQLEQSFRRVSRLSGELGRMLRYSRTDRSIGRSESSIEPYLDELEEELK